MSSVNHANNIGGGVPKNVAGGPIGNQRDNYSTNNKFNNGSGVVESSNNITNAVLGKATTDRNIDSGPLIAFPNANCANSNHHVTTGNSSRNHGTASVGPVLHRGTGGNLWPYSGYQSPAQSPPVLRRGRVGGNNYNTILGGNSSVIFGGAR